MPVTPAEIQTACDGMAEGIFDQMKIQLKAQLAVAFATIPEDIRPDLDAEVKKAEPSWSALATAIATGVVQYLTANMKITNIKTSVPIHPTVQGQTALATIDGHDHGHTVSLTGAQADTIFTQSDDGTEHIRWKIPS
ncbi:MAG: hypothetical protein WCI67_08955 [Chloroflexales bacterium]